MMHCVLQDLNDNRPTFSMQSFNASISEDVLPGFNVTTLTATDEDSGDLGRVVYSVSEVRGTIANESFVIDEVTGVVRTVGSFDREAFEGPYVVIVSSIELLLS